MIPIPNPESYTVPPSTGFVPDRLGVRRVCIDVNRTTNQYTASFTPCPANATAWGPTDAAEVSSPDLVAELMATPDSPEKLEALTAVQSMADSLVVIARFLLVLRD